MIITLPLESNFVFKANINIENSDTTPQYKLYRLYSFIIVPKVKIKMVRITLIIIKMNNGVLRFCGRILSNN